MNNLSIDIPQKNDFKLCTIRNLIMAYQGWSIAISHFYIPIPIVHTLSGIGPIFVFIMDYYKNGVKINKKQIVGIILGLVGVVLIINGRIIIHFIDPSYSLDFEFKNYKSQNLFVVFLVSLNHVSASILWSYATVITKDIKKSDPLQIALNSGFIIFLTSSVFHCFNGSGTFSTQKFITSLFLSGSLAAISANCMIRLLLMVKNSGTLTILTFVNVIVGYFISIFVYKESQNFICLIGIILIVVGLSKTIFQKD